MTEVDFEPLGKVEERITMSDQGETHRLVQWRGERARSLLLGAIVGFFAGGFFATVCLMIALAIMWWLGYLEISL